MPTDAQRRNLASAHHAEVQALKDKLLELEKQLENAFSAINYWKEEAGRYKFLGGNEKFLHKAVKST